MIKVKYPLEKQNLNQENFIQSIAEDNREYHELLFSYGNAVYIYNSWEIESNLVDYEDG